MGNILTGVPYVPLLQYDINRVNARTKRSKTKRYPPPTNKPLQLLCAILKTFGKTQRSSALAPLCSQKPKANSLRTKQVSYFKD